VPWAVFAAAAAAAVVTVVAVAAPAALDETQPRPVVQPVTVNTSLPAIGFSHVPSHAIGFSHVPPRGTLGSLPTHGPRQVPKQGGSGG
jgi:hypothetical protein